MAKYKQVHPVRVLSALVFAALLVGRIKAAFCQQPGEPYRVETTPALPRHCRQIIRLPNCRRFSNFQQAPLPTFLGPARQVRRYRRKDRIRTECGWPHFRVMRRSRSWTSRITLC